MNSNDYAVVVAHPDDEILFASSLLKSAKKVIICFSDVFDNDLVTFGRLNLQKDFPLDNFIFLNVPQARSSKIRTNWRNPTISKYGLSGDRDYESYKNNFYLLKKKIYDELKNINTIYTHSEWGEYGHVEHVQIYRVICSLKKILNFKIKVFSYISNKNLNFFYKCYQSFPLQFEKKRTNKNLFNLLAKHYLKHKCWTWHDNYQLPKYEYFYEIGSDNFNKFNLYPMRSFYVNYIFKEPFKSNYRSITIIANLLQYKMLILFLRILGKVSIFLNKFMI